MKHENKKIITGIDVGTTKIAVIIAEAKKTAEILKGEGDSERNKIFAGAFGKDPAFFSFYRSMQSYEKALIGNETSLILSPDSDFFKFFGKSGARKFRSRSTKPSTKKN